MSENRLSIVFPWPDSKLMPNRKNGRHYMATSAIKKKAREDARVATLAAIKSYHQPITGPVHVRVTFVAKNRRYADLDNLLASIKPHLDGVAEALGIDDRLFCPITIDRGLDSHKKGFVMVEIG
jgi:crossover junction endodeoxyribonuclease RusA